jgi:tetratricopeptide (TPR) repeat protein
VQHLLLAAGEGRYRLHAIVAIYARDHFDESDELANVRAMQVAHAQAAQYYMRQAKTSVPPREKRDRISDIHDLTEATWQLCQAEQWQAAYNLMLQEGIFADLRRWGGNGILLELCRQLLPLDKWHPEASQAAYIYNHLGRLYDDLGKMEEARDYLEQALSIFRNGGKYPAGEARALNSLGRIYGDLGEKERALDYYQQALSIYQGIGDRRGKARQSTIWATYMRS